MGTGRPSELQLGWSLKQKLLWVCDKFGEAMEEDYRSALEKFWQTVGRLRRGKQFPSNTVYSRGGELLTSTVSGGGKNTSRYAVRHVVLIKLIMFVNCVCPCRYFIH